MTKLCERWCVAKLCVCVTKLCCDKVVCVTDGVCVCVFLRTRLFQLLEQVYANQHQLVLMVPLMGNSLVPRRKSVFKNLDVIILIPLLHACKSQLDIWVSLHSGWYSRLMDSSQPACQAIGSANVGASRAVCNEEGGSPNLI